MTRCEDCIHNGTNKDNITCKECVSAEAEPTIDESDVLRTDIGQGGGDCIKATMSDLISRADAIDAVDRIKSTDNWQCAVIALLSSLPSADATCATCADRALCIMPAPDGNWKACKDYRPSAEAVQGWRTGKPTKGGKYIVTLIGIGGYRFVSIMHYDKPFMPNIEVSGACWYRDDDEWGDVVYDDKDILAWMPLPEPYREEREVEE